MRSIRLLIVLSLALAFGKTASAQIQAYGVATPGAYLKAGTETVVAGWAGFEAPLLTVEDRRFAAVTRFGACYVDLEDDIEGLSVFVAGRKSIACGYTPSMYVLVGGGVIFEILEGYDQADAALKLEFGVDVYRSLGIGVGVDYIPDPRTDDSWFVYGSVDLVPLFCGK
jgi:hypothetical protein